MGAAEATHGHARGAAAKMEQLDRQMGLAGLGREVGVGKPINLESGLAGETKESRGAGAPGGAGDALLDVRAKLERLFKREVKGIVLSGLEEVEGVERAARLLRNLVRKGTLKVGDQVPGNHLADAIGVHRNTMSKALKQLADEGLVKLRRGRPARIVAVQAALPPETRRSAMISHAKAARDHRLEISTAIWDVRQCPLSAVEEGPRARVGRCLALADTDEVIEFSRIRLLSSEGHRWFPGLAELAFFAAKRTPAFFFEDLQEAPHVGSIYDFLLEHGIIAVNSEYRVQIERLPRLFVQSWAGIAGSTPARVANLPFLRLETTTHSPQGPLQYSIAFVKEDLYVLSGTDLAVEIRPEGVLAAEEPRILRPEPIRGFRAAS